ncbi:conserved hypothetical protein [Pseudarthrobacter chlorophenolicus A6]|uniref:Uncharacterized protein n=1 Tax=Pseudarthrobacter chlorophenolicus (strain ATCC 700700 / DSM 12829 / CIP 107037 / JCM 12360 / KCTC 9906 / NCIMB 13794 / A6) TaxID=452863 RepID=B8HAJ7_PSECP|nr:hypothetical protein [Pseudarthrobacter chlorophenolicus]ACL38458.1 conserved hypothetical protein [Pseudarthrobacter chlorophenolicus A6]SDQ48439.1 hypothetical protein SAMN04489738_1073 [Pseudarthrobacter chlorophenolicus]
MPAHHAFHPTAAAAATHSGGSPRGAYRYRGSARPDPAAARVGEIRDLLEQQRQMISLRSSRLRALFSELNERVAQAVCDGVKVTTIAQAAGVPVTTIRGIGLGRDGLYPSGLPAEEQLRSISRLADEVTAVEAARAAVERHRVQVLAAARKQRLLDDYQLASASGLKHDEIRKMTRGVNTGPEA